MVKVELLLTEIWQGSWALEFSFGPVKFKDVCLIAWQEVIAYVSLVIYFKIVLIFIFQRKGEGRKEGVREK